MTRGRYYSTVMPIAGIVYVILLITVKGHHIAVVGALAFAIIAIAGGFLDHDDAGKGGRPREERRQRRARRSRG